jgi:cytochrome c oxidase cbb3-type subunit I/II
MYWVRVLGGLMYFSGALLACVNFYKTWAARPAKYEDPEFEAPKLMPDPSLDLHKTGNWTNFHRVWERKPLLFSILSAIAVLTASLCEIIPTFLIKSNVPTIASVKPYTPLELAGREIYIAEGCYNCHSQMIRPIRAETERYGEYSKPGEFVYDHPFQWGSRRIGPDLHRVGGKYPSLWHVRHMADPASVTRNSIMPPFPWLATDLLGVPYGDAINHAQELAHAQAKTLAADIKAQGGPDGLEDKKIIALVAYLQRLGTDIKAKPAADTKTVGQAK